MSALCQACLQRGYAGPRTPCPCSQSSSSMSPNSIPEFMASSASNYYPIYLNGGSAGRSSPYARYSSYYPSMTSFARRSGAGYYGHPSYASSYGNEATTAASSMLTTMLASASEPMSSMAQHNLPFYQYVAATSSPYYTSSHPLVVSPRPVMSRRSSPLILVAAASAAPSAPLVDPMMAAASTPSALKYFALPSYHQPQYALPSYYYPHHPMMHTQQQQPALHAFY